ncbi:hypothetical protein T09_5801 [Trichinella sp. T9]|nr:hypothetical protein T09_5801 [Trichinella sp. T9]
MATANMDIQTSPHRRMLRPRRQRTCSERKDLSEKLAMFVIDRRNLNDRPIKLRLVLSVCYDAMQICGARKLSEDY